MSGFSVPAGRQSLTLGQILELRQTALLAASRTTAGLPSDNALIAADKFMAWLMDGEL